MDAGMRRATDGVVSRDTGRRSAPLWRALSTQRTQAHAQEALASSGRWTLRRALPFLGPAFIAAVAYVDPGNFATNIQAGSTYGYTLLWVILAANLVAILLQTLSAKVGIATGKNLPQLCHELLPRRVNYLLWGVAEIAAMATDLAEFLGAAIGFNLLLHVPLLIAGIMTGVATFGILALQQFGFRPMEIVIAALIGVIAGSYLVEAVMARPNLGQIAVHAVVPQFGGAGGAMLAVGILGATVMPHVIYLHSALIQGRVPLRGAADARKMFRLERFDIWLALGIAGLVNGAMLIVAAAVFYSTGHTTITQLDQAYRTLTPLLGQSSSALFGVALLVSGLSSSTVGTMAGQVVMGGFLGWRIPVLARRAITMAPALLVIALGINPTQTLVLSQVILSFALPFAVIPLIYFTSKSDLMGDLVNRAWTRRLAWGVAAGIILLNITLLWQTFASH
ncbi:MAG TPA: Nramp family divalent metal transporter [Ktedonobacterales bacterium]|jgi:manganese transport protein|nr:Nramp family divalent metal transporter [Ktedonobacterales bacterium]